MEKLIKGIHKFQTTYFNKNIPLFKKLSTGQNPMALVITCSDSRVSPEMITQADPGDLFILRIAGNVVPPYGASKGGGVESTVEYAASVLGVKDIIICGHTQCGVMQALLNPESVKELPAVSNWLSHAESTRRIVKDSYSHLEYEALLRATVEENVLVQLENLRTHPAVAVRLAKGDLQLHGWVYKIETGEVFNYDPEEEQFMPISQDNF